jgi:hypothetical protein
MKEKVKNPGLKELCYQDELIKEFGIHLLDKLGTQEEQRRKDQDNIRTTRAVRGDSALDYSNLLKQMQFED